MLVSPCVRLVCVRIPIMMVGTYLPIAMQGLKHLLVFEHTLNISTNDDDKHDAVGTKHGTTDESI